MSPSHRGVLLPIVSYHHAMVCCSRLCCCRTGVHCSPTCHHRTIVLGCTAPCHVTITLSCWGVLLPIVSCHGMLLPIVLLSYHHTGVHCSPTCHHCTVMLGCTAPCHVAIAPLY